MRNALGFCGLSVLLILSSEPGSVRAEDPTEEKSEQDPGAESRDHKTQHPDHGSHDGTHEHGSHGQGDSHAGRPGGGHGHGMPHDFSDAEAWSKRFDDPARDAWQKPTEVVGLMGLEPGMTVADLGAGTGYFVGHLSAAVGAEGKVLALEPEANMVHFIAQRAKEEGWSNVESHKIPYDSPGVPKGALDRILIVNTWHHIENRGAYAARLRDSLAPGGQVVVVDFTRESPTGPPAAHRLAPEQILDELAEGGLTGRVVEEELPRQFVVIAGAE